MSDATPAEAGQEKAAGAHYAVPKDGPDADVSDEELEGISGGKTVMSICDSSYSC
jgi:hypothetical protein